MPFVQPKVRVTYDDTCAAVTKHGFHITNLSVSGNDSILYLHMEWTGNTESYHLFKHPAPDGTHWGGGGQGCSITFPNYKKFSKRHFSVEVDICGIDETLSIYESCSKDGLNVIFVKEHGKDLGKLSTGYGKTPMNITGFDFKAPKGWKLEKGQ